MRFLRSTLGVVAWVGLSALSGMALDKAAMLDTLQQAAKVPLDDAALKPWHLKLSFQLYDAKGEPSGQGTIEEWFVAPTQRKTVFTSASYSSTEIRTGDGLYRTPGAASAPYFVNLALQQVVHPIRVDASDGAGLATVDSVRLGQAALDCVMPIPPIKGHSAMPLGLFPTYCFNGATSQCG